MGKRFEDMTVGELKERLRNKGLKVSGNKSELIERLRGGNDNKSVRKSPQKGPSGGRVPTNVVDKELYIKVREKVKSRVNSWPSAYASGQIVSEYKKAGGRYRGGKQSPKKTPLDRWYKEKWVNVCEKGHPPCGRSKADMGLKDYPYCRPSVRVTKSTPKTVKEIPKSTLKEMCEKKRKSPAKRVRI